MRGQGFVLSILYLPLIELLVHKPATSFWKYTKITPRQGIKSHEKLYNVKCAITDIYDMYLYFYWLLTLFMETISPL